MPTPYALLAALALPAAGVTSSAAPAPPSRAPPTFSLPLPLDITPAPKPPMLMPFLAPHVKQDYVVIAPGSDHFYILTVPPPKSVHY